MLFSTKLYALIQNMSTANPIGIMWKRVFELSLFKNKHIASEKWVNCFCNYWIADKYTWDRYIEYLKKTIALLDSDPVLKWMCENITQPHRGKVYPITPFFLEYLFGLFLVDNPDISYKILPNKITIPDMSPRTNKAFNPSALTKSLKEIYEDHKTPAGMGDKGTLHHYIDNYEKLFTPYRFRNNVFLEVGVEHGHSLRMWRDYFPRSKIIGADIKESPKAIPGCEFYLCDQSKKNDLDNLANGTTFDIIIDDGSHVLEHQILTHQRLFKRLNKGGIYIIEDIQNPETDIPAIEKACGKCEIYDTRKESGRYDDILLVWRKT